MLATNTIADSEKKIVKRFEYLDSLRGLAAISVLLGHLIGAYSLPSGIVFLEQTFMKIIWHGESAVTLFFVLSGFVLSLKYYSSERGMEGFSYPSYAIARVFRIFPLFLVVLLISFLIRNYFYEVYSTIPRSTNWFDSLWKAKLSFIDLIQQSMLLIRIPHESSSRLIPQDWTLTEELKQSLVLPILVFISLKRQYLLFFVIALVVVFKPLNPIFNFYLGIVAAQNLTFFRKIWKKNNIIFKILMLIIALVLYSGNILFTGNYVEPIAVGIGSFLLILITLSSIKLQKILSWPLLSLLGRLSYGIYLIHFFVLLSFIPFAIHIMNTLGLYNHYVILILSLTLLLLITACLSYFTYYLVEIPGIKIGKKISKFNFMYISSKNKVSIRNNRST